MQETAFEPIRILENRSGLRSSFIRKRFSNGIDLIRFYTLIGRVAAIPVLGTWFIRPVLNQYIRYVDSNGMILPLEQIEEVIRNASHLFVDPCDCRLEFNRCSAPLFTCLRINLAARVREEASSRKGVSKAEALKVARNAYDNGLIFCLEQCIQPYQMNICMCCACCCIQYRFRFEMGHRAFEPGPFVPSFDRRACRACGTCMAHCPAHAIRFADRVPEVSMGDCLGCGQCSRVCPEKAVEMIFEPERLRKDSQPGWLRLAGIRLFMVLYMFPMFRLFRLFGGSHEFKRGLAVPNENDVLDGAAEHTQHSL